MPPLPLSFRENRKDWVFFQGNFSQSLSEVFIINKYDMREGVVEVCASCHKLISIDNSSHKQKLKFFITHLCIKAPDQLISSPYFYSDIASFSPFCQSLDHHYIITSLYPPIVYIFSWQLHHNSPFIFSLEWAVCCPSLLVYFSGDFSPLANPSLFLLSLCRWGIWVFSSCFSSLSLQRWVWSCLVI